jgi:hypothetical protein
LPKAMLEALRKGAFDDSAEQLLRKELETSAIERINVIRSSWVNLRTSNQPTFNSYWVEAGQKSTCRKFHHIGN